MYGIRIYIGEYVYVCMVSEYIGVYVCMVSEYIYIYIGVYVCMVSQYI